ncbi:hypothetical protein pb186bvf_018804 [Paramecium bursaria]
MNNIHKVADPKNLIYRALRLQLHAQNINWDQYVNTAKYPLHPKIVVLQNDSFIKNIILKQHNDFRIVDGSAYNNDEDSIQKLAEQVQLESTQAGGALLIGYPKNAVQAEKLDYLLDGVNLAINLKISEQLSKQITNSFLTCKTCGNIFNTELPFIAPTHPGYQNDCSQKSKCNLTLGGQVSTQANEDVLNYYESKGLLLNYEIDDLHLFYDSKEFKERFAHDIITHIKL